MPLISFISFPNQLKKLNKEKKRPNKEYEKYTYTRINYTNFLDEFK